ncbi:MAG: AMP-binding protein [Solirubrobacterales bacterium]
MAIRFNFAIDVVERLGRERPGDEALRAIATSGNRESLTFAEVAEGADNVAAGLAAAGVGKGDVVMTMIGARPEWVLATLGTWRLGAVALPGAEQLRAADIALRIDNAKPILLLIAERDRREVEGALRLAQHAPRVLEIDRGLPTGAPIDPSPTITDDAALIVFTSGSGGEPKGVVHTQGYLLGQRLQAEHWYDARPGELAWCTAASGWSLSSRNAFVAPWITGAACLLHDARFDPGERLEIVAAEGINVLCQSPTEYRMIAKHAQLVDWRSPALRHMLSAGEPLNPEIIATFHAATGLDISDGYGQTETGAVAGTPPGSEARPGSMGMPLPGCAVEVLDPAGEAAEQGEMCMDPATIPTFFAGYLNEDPIDRAARWHTGDRVRRDSDGHLWFEGRIDDVIVSAGYRIGPFEVESALVSHPAVAEAAAVAAPDDERGSIVKAVVVLRDGHRGNDRLARDLQDHAKQVTAPYKHPRAIEFRDELPKTSSGKIKRAALRAEAAGAAQR